jgi:hypothetical protein
MLEQRPEDKPERAVPTIRITTNITHVVDQEQAALMQLPNGPILFQRGRKLCLIARGVPPPKWLHRPADAPIIQLVTPARITKRAKSITPHRSPGVRRP